jgi:hypothetical protein
LANLNNYVASSEDEVTAAVTFSSGSADIAWTSNPVAVLSVVQFSGGSLPANITADKLYYVTSRATNSIQVSAIPSGTAVVASGNGSGTALWAPLGFTKGYMAQRCRGWQQWAAGFGVNKMIAYEGGFSPDLMGVTRTYNTALVPFAFNSCFMSTPESTVPTRANPCVVTINNVSGIDNPNSTKTINFNPQVGNPCLVGMVIAFKGTGMPELVNNSTTFTANASGATQTWTAHNLKVNEIVVFSTGAANITRGQFYYVTSVPTADTFEFSATRGGSPITPATAASTAVVSGWMVTGVAGTQVTIDCDSSGFAVPSASMTTSYINSVTLVNNFRSAVLYYSTSLLDVTSNVYSAYAAAGGTFPSQYQFAGTGSVWYIIQPDIFGTYSQAYYGIAAYNS